MEPAQFSQEMGVYIADEKHHLKKQDACCPNRSRPTEYRKNHFAYHRLAAEKKKRAQKQSAA
jgi:hypothetical protein